MLKKHFSLFLSSSLFSKYSITVSRDLIESVVGIFGINIQSDALKIFSCSKEIPGGQSSITISKSFKLLNKDFNFFLLCFCSLNKVSVFLAEISAGMIHRFSNTE